MSAELILNLINEMLDNPKFDQITEQDEQVAGKDTIIKFPKFKINEKHWGKNIGTEDRAIIERIGNQLQGDNPLDRVQYLETFLTEAETIKEDITVGEVMGSLMFLDIFASIVFEFNPAVAGFLFEALFAGIFEGFQIDAKEGGGEAGTTDAILNVKPKGKGSKSGVEYSFKLLKSKDPAIKGSFKDLVDGISKSPGAQETYLVVLKTEADDAMSLDFYEYDITQENWFEWVGVPLVGTAPVLGKTKFNLEKGQLPQMPKGISIVSGRAETGKLFNGEFIKKATTPASARDAYNKIEAEEVLVYNPSAQAITDEYALTKDGERVTADNKLVVGQEYEINAVTGSKRVVDYEKSANFKELYKDFLKPGAFEGPNGEDFVTYVGEGVYKEDPEFFDRLKTLGTYTGKGGAGQFLTSGGYMKSHPAKRGPYRLTLDRKRFQVAANAYTNLVGKQIFEIFTNLSELVEDVSGYFLGVSANERNDFADKSKKKSKELARSAEENLVKVESDVMRGVAVNPAPASKTPSKQGAKGGGTAGLGSQLKANESKEFDGQLKLLMKEVFGG